ncbi:MAG TPA: thiamine pyrophosphate-dependent enzyme [Segeticoccus sp.]|uniref:thiamine pyrophosphate-dependent enzyme n=1 Tax=Segeticoccus sp. TaxID=2706531 RepID=UPI002D7E1F79|nr:thiamine pyrophosphate-dependent enzyme [Segeticoccus sp.]HET8599886.1 thiamine pyrophosphate-dependent enzyme [Segeticoccus sp.]
MSEEKTAADAFVERLIEWGVDTIFGLPGDGINGLMDALNKHREQIHYVHTRHEEVAAMAAVGYAKFTGKLGVCFATTGPGSAHMLNGILDARVEQAPILAISGMTYHDLVGTSYLQDINEDYMLNDVTVYNQRIMGPAHVTNVVDYAVRSALTERGPAHLAFPIDFQAAPADSGMRYKRNVPGHTSTSYRPPIRVPENGALQAAADALRGKTKPAILAGAGARGAGDELEQVAEKLGAPVIKAMLGKDCIPDDSPYTTGSIALVGTLPSQEALEQCDALLIVGSSMPYIEWYPQPGQATVVQIDDMPERIGLRAPAEVGLCGDAAATLRALLPMLERNENRSFLQQAQDGMRDWWALMEERGTREDVPMKPQVPAWALNDVLADNAIICGDSGTVTTWVARQVKVRRGMNFSFSGTNCSMAAGLPYAIGAQTAYPDRQVVVFTGDGSLTMQLGDVMTCVQHNLPVKIVVVRNDSLGLIKWEQMVFLGNPEYGVNMTALDFVKFADACGIYGARVEDPKDCLPALRAAMQHPGPAIVEMVVDQNEPPIPAKATTQQIKKLMTALKDGTPNRNRIALQMTKDMLDESSFEASPGSRIPDKVADAASHVVDSALKHTKGS